MLTFLNAYCYVGLLVLFQTAWIGTAKTPKPITVETEIDSTLNLPCDAKAPLNDRVAVILWYKDDHHESIYTYDARNTTGPSSVNSPRHTSLHFRASFNMLPKPHLTIHNIKESDAGYYQCRVDFLVSSSKTTYLRVQVITKPESIHLEDTHGVVLKEEISAQLAQTLSLICVVKGGNPPPHIRWTMDNIPLEPIKQTTISGSIFSSMVFSHLERRHHFSDITCEASYSQAMEPLVADIIIKLNMPPISVFVYSQKQTVTEGDIYSVFCDIQGAFPPPKITWTITRKGRHPEILGKKLTSRVADTIWSLNQTAIWKDDGAQIGCSAASPALPHLSLHNTTTISIQYSPRLQLGLGKHLTPKEIVEGMDVYFVCSSRANPSAYKLSWFIGEEEITQNATGGILVSDDHLVIQSISRSWTGKFTCRASNVVGDASSEIMKITVRYAPVCKDNSKKIYEAALGEDVYLPCEVMAYPANVSFSWTFSNSLSQPLQERLPQDSVKWDGLQSVLRYKPKTLQEYGTLRCWAANSAGQQIVPCSLSLRPAGAPSPPRNCSVSNQTWDTLEVTCYPPSIGISPSIARRFDSQSDEKFIKEKEFIKSLDAGILYLITVYQKETMSIVYNNTGTTGQFLIRGLSSGLDYLITVSRLNSRGRSSEITLEALTLRAAENRMRDHSVPSTDHLDNTWIVTLGSAIGSLIAVICMTGSLLFIIRQRCKKRRNIAENENFTDSADDTHDTLGNKSAETQSLYSRQCSSGTEIGLEPLKEYSLTESLRDNRLSVPTESTDRQFSAQSLPHRTPDRPTFCGQLPVLEQNPFNLLSLKDSHRFVSHIGDFTHKCSPNTSDADRESHL